MCNLEEIENLDEFFKNGFGFVFGCKGLFSRPPRSSLQF